MSHKRENRVEFFSKEDLMCTYMLSLAEPILRNFDETHSYSLADIVELYQIKLYIDNEIFLSVWTQEDKLNFRKTVEKMWKVITHFWIQINDDNIKEHYDNLENGYQRTFWALVEKLKTYDHVSEKTFKGILFTENIWIREVLHQKKLTKYYSKIIRDYLLDNDKSAELLLTQFEERHLTKHSDLYFPDCLTIEDKETIILKYVNSHDPNLTYIRLIVNSRDTHYLKLSSQTRLKAIKIEREKNDEVLKSGSVVEKGIQVSFSEDQIIPVKIKYEGNLRKISYSIQWIEKNKDSYSLFHVFSSLFKFIDIHGLITLISKIQELDVLESVLMQSKNDYSAGFIFEMKNKRSHMEMFLFSNYLKKSNNSIETVISNYIKECFVDFFGLSNFRIKFPSETSSNLEKVRMIAPEFESILKQYKLFTLDGNIDHDLLEINSVPLQFKEIPSLVNKKYAYSFGNEILNLQYSFFSDQSMLYYVRPFQTKYRNLFSLLSTENVCFNNFENYQKPCIEKFITDGYLKINSEGFIKIQNYSLLFIVGKLYFDEVVSYWNFPPEVRLVIDDMYRTGMVRFGDTLFSEPEQKYFNYFLNKSEFTNGLDLRNRYLHGSNKDSDIEHKNSYLLYLKLFVLALLKIEDDIKIKFLISKKN